MLISCLPGQGWLSFNQLPYSKLRLCLGVLVLPCFISAFVELEPLVIAF